MLKADQEYNDLFIKACQGNIDAVDFLTRLAKLYRVWDDIYDGNREHTGKEVSECFAEAMFGLMDNKFYASYRDILWPQIMLSYNAWMDANDWAEHEDEKKRYCSFFIKEYCDEIIMLCAFIIGGKEHMRSISKLVREQYLKGA